MKVASVVTDVAQSSTGMVGSKTGPTGVIGVGSTGACAGARFQSYSTWIV